MKNLILTFFILSLIACSAENENPKLIGNWQGISWDVNGHDSGRNAAEMIFQFNEDDTYRLDFQNQKEEGKFRLTGAKLYTTEKGKMEKVVRVVFSGKDTLTMEMNRAGDEEELVLVRN